MKIPGPKEVPVLRTNHHNEVLQEAVRYIKDAVIRSMKKGYTSVEVPEFWSKDILTEARDIVAKEMESCGWYIKKNSLIYTKGDCPSFFQTLFYWSSEPFPIHTEPKSWFKRYFW